jgi:hypothetical protein
VESPVRQERKHFGALAKLLNWTPRACLRVSKPATNNYALVPYTGLRQPLVKPLGETRSIQRILRDLAHQIGGGMEQYFAFESEEEF